jgi:uncharacterized 2Fe-2S/4Fe-4S cluster protein (DUF4445 family)
MQHLFWKRDPSGMALVPFQPAFLESLDCGGRELGIPVNKVVSLPNLSAFIGSDIVSGLAALESRKSEMPYLLLDLGTNAEMALVMEDRIICTSAAAGPALEGAGISCGMGGVRGAISRVSRSPTGELELGVIGDAPPRGLCGAGLVDTLALMRAEGVFDETGAFEGLPEAKWNLTGDISLCAKDLRAFQVAKAAIYSGVELLIKKAGLTSADIKTAYLAGGLGSYIRPESALKLGLLPEGIRLEAPGNLSLSGAILCLQDSDFLERCKALIKRCTVMELASEPIFMDAYIEAMLFP